MSGPAEGIVGFTALVAAGTGTTGRSHGDQDQQAEAAGMRHGGIVAAPAPAEDRTRSGRRSG